MELITWKPVPDKPGYVNVDKMVTYREFTDALISHLKTAPMHDETFVHDWLEYVSPDKREYDGRKQQPRIPEFNLLYAFCVPGGSEGYCFHIEVVARDYTRENIVIAKTLCTNKKTVMCIMNAINEFIYDALLNY
jgi:hypothetical protein